MRRQQRVIKFVLFVLLIFCTHESLAYIPQEGNVTAALGPYLYKTNYGRSDVPYAAPELLGFSLIALGDLNRNGALEVGIFTMKKTFLGERDGRYLIQTAETLHITMGYRYYISPKLSTSLSFFSAYPLGTPSTKFTQFSDLEGMDTSARDKVEYGFDIAGQFEIASFNAFGIFVDGRYSWNVTPKNDEHADHFGVIMGMRYTILSK